MTAMERSSVGGGVLRVADSRTLPELAFLEGACPLGATPSTTRGYSLWISVIGTSHV